MLGLAAALLGVALATAGTFLFFSNRRAGFSGRGWRAELASVSMLVGGGTILLSTVALRPDNLLLSPQIDPDRLTEQQPTAAGAGNIPPLAYRRMVVLGWGTPSDSDSADDAAVAGYTAAVNQLGEQLLSALGRDAEVQTVAMTRSEYQALRSTSLATSDWCQRTGGELLLAIGVGASTVNGDYTLWREPVYEMLDCTNGQALRRSSRAVERSGDRFPYQTAMTEQIVDMLREFPRAATAQPDGD